MADDKSLGLWGRLAKALSPARVREVLVEKNVVYSIPKAQVGFFVNSKDTTLRNNIFIGAGATLWDYSCILVTQRGIEPYPSGCEIYHNTRYNALALLSTP